jgi:cobalt-zinc-cadmium efflux system protein
MYVLSAKRWFTSALQVQSEGKALMSEHSGHSHGPKSGTRLWLSLIVTLLFVVGEASAGWISHSLALLSDAGHNLSDALALGLAAYAVWVARKPATAKHTYGFHRVSILAAQFNAATLVAIAVFIGIEAVQRFKYPEPVSGSLMIWVAAIAVFMNTAIALALSGDAKESLNSRAAFVHMAGDAISSLAVVIAGIIVHYTGWLYADPVVSLLITAFILYSAVGIVRDATDILMEATPKDLDVDMLILAIKSVRPVCDVHDLHIWQVGDGLNFLSCHVALPATCSLNECAAIVGAINRTLHDDFKIEHATIQTEIEGLCDMNESNDLYCAMEAHGGHEHSHSH